MNDNNLNNNMYNDQNKYKATRNLNTEIENPALNINSAYGVNIRDANENNAINQNELINNQTYEVPPMENYNNHIQEPNNSFTDNAKNNDYSQNQQESFTNQSNSFIPLENQNIPNEFENNVPSYNSPSTNEEKVTYTPTMKEKKKPKSLKIPAEVKVTLFIVFILLIFVLLIPYVFDFIKQIELSFTR